MNRKNSFSKDAHPSQRTRSPQYTADEHGLKRAIVRLLQFEQKYKRLPKSSDKELGSIASTVKTGRWKPLGVVTWNQLMRRAFGRINVERTIYESTKEGLKKAIQALQDFYTTYKKYPTSKDLGMGIIVTAIHAHRWTRFNIHKWEDIFQRAFRFTPKVLRQNPYEGEAGLKRAMDELRAFKIKQNRLPKYSVKQFNPIRHMATTGRWTPWGVSSWNDLMRKTFNEVTYEHGKYLGKEGLGRAIQEIQSFIQTQERCPKTRDPGMSSIHTALQRGRWKPYGFKLWPELVTYALERLRDPKKSKPEKQSLYTHNPEPENEQSPLEISLHQRIKHRAEAAAKAIIFPNSDLPPLPERALTGELTKEDVRNQDGSPFHTVHIWEFTNLYVVLNEDLWTQVSIFLKDKENRSITAYLLEESQSTLSALRDHPELSISIPVLKAITQAAGLEPTLVEQSLKAVRFSQGGKLETLTFPFVMDIYAWRLLCHIAGDGYVQERDERSYPELRWTQKTENQSYMRDLIAHLARRPGGKSMNINYPKALVYTLLGTIPELKIYNLRKPEFVQYILDLPMSYREFKIQFLTAFIPDDGCISCDISLYQKDKKKLEIILELCNQLGYEHSGYPIYRQKRDGMHEIHILHVGIQKYNKDLLQLLKKYRNDPLLGLWQKQHKLETFIPTISEKRLNENDRAITTYIKILSVLVDYQIRDTKELRNHPDLEPYLGNLTDKLIRDRFRNLTRAGVIKEVKKRNEKSYRPKKWTVANDKTLEELIKQFFQHFGNRKHEQSYKRKFLTTDIVEKSKAKIEAKGIKGTPRNVARDIGCSVKQIYKRPDLRKIFGLEEKFGT